MIWAILIIAILISIYFVINTEDKDAKIIIGGIGVVSVIIILILFATGRYSNARDTEIWNGEVSAKERVTKNCKSGWNDYRDSFCTEYRTRVVNDGPRICTTSGTGKNKSQTCHQPRKTQYNYDYRWERKWFVDLNLKGRRKTIRRVDPQGANMPPFWDNVKVGDPASIKNNYNNWVKASSNSLFHEDGDTLKKYEKLMPVYPDKIYEYYKIDRIVSVGVTIDDKFNRELSDAARSLGPKVQMNPIIVVVDSKIAKLDYIYAVRRYWKGFKKNDAVTFIGVNNNVIEWASSLSWSKASIYDITVRDDLVAMKQLDMSNVIKVIKTRGIEHYKRRPMKDFEFLKKQIPVPTVIYVASILILMLMTGLIIYIGKRKSNNRYRRFR